MILIRWDFSLNSQKDNLPIAINAVLGNAKWIDFVFSHLFPTILCFAHVDLLSLLHSSPSIFLMSAVGRRIAVEADLLFALVVY